MPDFKGLDLEEALLRVGVSPAQIIRMRDDLQFAQRVARALAMLERHSYVLVECCCPFGAHPGDARFCSGTNLN